MTPKQLELLEEAREFHQTSNFKKGLKSAEKARKIALKEDDGGTAIEALRIMADCALNARDMNKAEFLYTQLIQESVPSNNRYYLAAASWGMGQIALHKMSYHEAISLLKQGLDYAESVADNWYTAWNAFSLGNALRGIGKLDEARYNLEKSLSAFKTINMVTYVTWAERSLSEISASADKSKDDLIIWLCPLCGSKLEAQQADSLKKGKTIACEYCRTSIG